jgi:hypothetical protein
LNRIEMMKQRKEKQILGQPYLSVRCVTKLSDLHAALRHTKLSSIAHEASAVCVNRGLVQCRAYRTTAEQNMVGGAVSAASCVARPS